MTSVSSQIPEEPLPRPIRVLCLDEIDDCEGSESSLDDCDRAFLDVGGEEDCCTDTVSEDDQSWTLNDFAEVVDASVTAAFERKLTREEENTNCLTQKIEVLEAKIDSLSAKLGLLHEQEKVEKVGEMDNVTKAFEQLNINKNDICQDDIKKALLNAVKHDQKYGFHLPSQLPDLASIHKFRCDMPASADRFERALCRAYDGLPTETLDFIEDLVRKEAHAAVTAYHRWGFTGTTLRERFDRHHDNLREGRDQHSDSSSDDESECDYSEMPPLVPVEVAWRLPKVNYSDMPPLVDLDVDYSDMPPLVEVDTKIPPGTEVPDMAKKGPYYLSWVLHKRRQAALEKITEQMKAPLPSGTTECGTKWKGGWGVRGFELEGDKGVEDEQNSVLLQID